MPRRACEDSTGLRYEIGVLLSATASPVAVYHEVKSKTSALKFL